MVVDISLAAADRRELESTRQYQDINKTKDCCIKRAVAAHLLGVEPRQMIGQGTYWMTIVNCVCGRTASITFAFNKETEHHAW